MRPSAMTATAVALTATALVLAAPPDTVAQSGAGVSLTTPGASSQAGYFVAPDGSIQYRDETDGPSGPVTAAPLGSTGSAMADRMVTTPMAPDIFDAAPAPLDTVTLQSLQGVFDEGGGSIDASAGMTGGTISGSGDFGYTVENGTIVRQDAAPTPHTAPLYAPMPRPAPTYAEPAPMQAAPMQAPPMYAAPMQSEPMHAAPLYAAPPPAPIVQHVVETHSIAPEPYVMETLPPVAAPLYAEPLPFEPTPVVDHYASLEPTPLLRSGSDFAMDGDGAYGPSVLKRAGDGPAGRDAALFVAKSTIVELPTEAHEILVADPTRVRAVLRTARQMVLIGLQPGPTSVTAFDEDGKQILSLDANVRFDLRPLRRALAESFPGLVIEVKSVLDDVIVSGAVDGAAEADAVRNLVRRYLYSAMTSAGVDASLDDVSFVDRINSTAEDQILVKVRIAEMRRSVVKQFGVDFNLASDAALSAATGGIASNLTDFGSISNAFGVNGTALGGIAANIAGSFESTNFGALVRAFERHNVMRVLAEPTLTAVSGETASFLAGGQFPYPTSVDDGNIGFTFRDFGVALEFTPVVVGDGRISLTVATEISELTTEGSLSTGDLTIPGISIRKANTTVELPSGGTMSIAGMLLQRDANAHTGLPGLKNLPILGQLFSSTDYQKQETELVILVTPYIVKPGQEKDFRLPTDGFAPASDFDLFVLGRLHKVYGGEDGVATDHTHQAGAKDALEAPFGFILE